MAIDPLSSTLAAMLAVVNDPATNPLARATAGRAVAQLLALTHGRPAEDLASPGPSRAVNQPRPKPPRQRRRVVPPPPNRPATDMEKANALRLLRRG